MDFVGLFVEESCKWVIWKELERTLHFEQSRGSRWPKGFLAGIDFREVDGVIVIVAWGTGSPTLKVMAAKSRDANAS